MDLWMGAAVPPAPSRCQHSKQGEASPLQCPRRVLPSGEKRAGPRRHSRPRRMGTDRWPFDGNRLNADRHYATHGRRELEQAFQTAPALLRSILANRCERRIRRRWPLLASSLSAQVASRESDRRRRQFHVRPGQTDQFLARMHCPVSIPVCYSTVHRAMILQRIAGIGLIFLLEAGGQTHCGFD